MPTRASSSTRCSPSSAVRTSPSCSPAARDRHRSPRRSPARSPTDPPLPAYLRQLLLTNNPAGAALFSRWYAATRQLLDAMVELGAAPSSEDPAVRAAFLLANDLAVILLRDQIAAAIGDDPLTSAGLDRWAREVTAVYIEGAFLAPSKEPGS